MKKTILSILLVGFVALLAACGKGEKAATPPTSGQVGPYQPVPPIQDGTSIRYGADLQILDRGTFERFLEMTTGVCKASSSWWYGSYRCSNYSSSGYVIMEGQLGLSGGSANLVVGGRGNAWTAPLAANIRTVVQPVNSNQGFVLQDLSQMGYPSGRVRALVTNGSIAQNGFEVVLSYEGVDFATAVVYRY